MHKAKFFARYAFTLVIAGCLLAVMTIAGATHKLRDAQSGPLGEYGRILFKAKSLNSTYTVQLIGGTSDSYTVELKKPNLARIDTPTQLIVADGKNITTLNKADNVYYRRPSSDFELKAVMSAEAVNLWAGFFNPLAYNPIVTKNLGARIRKGLSLTGTEGTYDSKGDRRIAYYLSDADHLLRQAEINVNQSVSDGLMTSVVDTKSLVLDGDIKGDVFAFDAPTGSKSVTLAELDAVKWFTDLDEAKLECAKTGKKIFVDFSAVGDPVWERLNNLVYKTARFKREVQSRIVPLRIDLQKDPTLGQAYGITTIPTHAILDRKGLFVASEPGFATVKAFYLFLNDVLG